ncbi:MAG: hypothetical protein V4754_21010 [Pseudomonadota bacterium]
MSTINFEAIAALDLEAIKVKLMHKESGEGWSLDQVNAVEVEYRRFLYLMKLFPTEQTAPLFDVDIFWHYHILDTQKYAIDCEAVFGYFLHHFPYIGLRGEDDEAAHHRVGERMKQLYEQTFGIAYHRVQAGAQGDPHSAEMAFSGAQVAFSGAQNTSSVKKAAFSGAQVAFSGAQVAAGQATVAFSGAKVAFSGAQTGQTAAPVAFSGAKVAFSGAQVATGQAAVAFSGAKVAFSGAKVAFSGAKVAFSGAQTAKSEARVAFSGAKVAFSGAQSAQPAASVAFSGARVAFSGAQATHDKLAFSGAQIAFSNAQDSAAKASLTAPQQLRAPQPQPDGFYTARPTLNGKTR